MNTLEIELVNQKALKLLQDMEELNLIRVLKKKSGVSALRKQIQTRMSETEIDNQLLSVRAEWKRNIS
ncbi:hypothetical protein [Spirosoma sp. KUDC1026]|uniref:hypothetical protein n=1 Tax=Spirosoma sp. KUDC1026 TaxID=2745947 RepID=UPI00159BA10A|nr:hypothetical protein [Spirosoma sp. KUDC1026]QKZ15392.1 hypothetical protein HU175_23340 [Spirosoma sp. KUDC1026]